MREGRQDAERNPSNAPKALPSGRLGVSFALTRHLPLRDVLSAARLADDLDFDSLWIPETWSYDASALLSILASETRRIKLASGVFNVYSRSAALIAQAASTLSAISGGRFILGLGSSGPLVIERWHGLPFESPIQRTRDYIAIVRAALSGQKVEFEGETMLLTGFALGDLPPAQIPIYVAALGPRNVRMAGEIADGWLPIFAALGHMQSLLAQLALGAEHAGRQPADIDVAAYIPAAFGPRGDRQLRQQLAYYVGGMGTFYADWMRRIGLGPDADEIQLRWQSGDHLSAVGMVSDDLLALCTLGSEPQIGRERLALFRGEGIALPILTLPRGVNLAEVEGVLRGYAPGL